MLTTPEAVPHGDLIDTRAIAAELERLAELYAGRDRELRTAVAQHLKAEMARGRAKAEQLLLKDRRGRRHSSKSVKSREYRATIGAIG